MSILTHLRAFVLAWKRTLIVLASLLALYTVCGFFVLPAVLKSQLPKRVGTLLGREVSVGRVRTNPFALSVTIDEFLVKDRDGQPFLGWQRLYVNANASSLFTHTVAFAAIHLSHPYGRVVLEKGGRMNFSDILDRLGKEEPKAAPKNEASSRELYIGELSIQGAQVVLLDRSLSEPFATTLGPVTVELRGFRTERNNHSPYSFAGRTEAGETFSWTGVFSAEPLKSQGSFALEHLLLPKYHPYYKDQVAFDLRSGTASAKASYVFEWTEGAHTLKLHDGSLDLQHLQLAERGKADPAVELPSLEARGIQADLLENAAEISSLRLRDAKLDVVRLPNGQISLVNLLTPKPRPKPKEPEKPFQLRLNELSLSGFQVNFQDRATVRPVSARIKDLELSLKDFSLDPKASCNLTLAMNLNESGTVHAEGSITPFKPSADLSVKLQNLPLAPFDPYLDPAMDVRVNRGTLSLEGRARGAFAGAKSDFAAFTGKVSLDNFEVMDGAQQEPFIRYKALRLAGLELNTNPKVLKLHSADLIEHEYRLVIAKDGSSNVARAFKLGPAVPKSNLGAMVGGQVQATPEESYPVNIGQIHMQGGRLSFIDRSVEPNAALLISNLEGTNTGLSTSPDDKTSLNIKGLVGGLAPILIQGRAMPLRHDKDTDITVQITGADLTDFSPYAGQQVGYTIREGKLDLRAHVRIQDRKLKVEDSARLDHFYLGDQVPSPQATHLPVKLGLALLRDRKGVIELEVPVDGSLDDPDIHYGRMVWRALFNALGKVVASPFTLISKLIGSSEDLSFAAFPAGSSTLDAAEQKKLTALIKALQERPELRLEAEGTADTAGDAAAIKRAKLEALLRRAQWNARKEKGDEPELGPLEPSERERWLRAVYETAFPLPKGIKPSPEPASEMEQRLLGTLTVSPDELRSLAEARTLTVITALQQGGVDASRVFEVQGSDAAKGAGSKVYFALK